MAVVVVVALVLAFGGILPPVSAECVRVSARRFYGRRHVDTGESVVVRSRGHSVVNIKHAICEYLTVVAEESAG